MNQFGSKWQLVRSALWAAAISGPLLIWGERNSMALAHSGGFLVLLFVPVFPVLLLFGSDGPFGGVAEWLFNTLAVASQFIGTFLIVHWIRSRRARRGSDGA